MPRDRKVLAWALYDWANSAFVTTVMVGFFPVFFKQYYQQDVPAEVGTFRLGITNSAASLLVALAAPFLGAVADARSAKKRFLLLFTLLGAGATAALALLGPGEWTGAAVLYGLSVVGLSAALVFYDAFLPSVAEESSLDRVSSYGYALGYLGGGLLFLLNVLMFVSPAAFGLPDGVSAVKASFLTVAAWWLLFSLPLLFTVPEAPAGGDRLPLARVAHDSVRAVIRTAREIFLLRNVGTFLFAYWLYIDGVNSVAKMAVDFGVSVGIESRDLMIALLVTQFVGFPSALLMGRLAARVGARRAVMGGLVIYGAVTLWASRMTSAAEFFGLAVAVGTVQGGVQALSRSIFASMIPPGRSAEFFSFFNLVGKFATILGPLLVGLTARVTHSSRAGIASAVLLFLAGGVLLRRSGAE